LPPFCILDAIPAPIMPTPINPTFILASSLVG
jgi:hypothetical protein